MFEKAIRVLEFDKIVMRVMNLAASELGKEMAASLLPERDFSKILNLLKETSDGVSFISRKGSPPLGGVHDIRDSLKRVKVGAVLSPGELLKVADTLRASRNLKSYALDGAAMEDGNAVSELINCLVPHRRIEEKIRLSILSEEEISDNASPALASIRRQVLNLQNSIRDRLNDIIKSTKYQKYMQESIVTIRDGRYVVPVKQEHRSEIPGLVHDSSSSGATIFIEPMAVVEANNEIKQLKIKEQLEIERILRELTADVESILNELMSNIAILAKLDFIFAKARFSLDLNCICPGINDCGFTVIKKGRHPLLDPKTVVPIDFWIGDEFKTLVVTGPNTGGKTVTLKTVGLFTLMTQAGLHIPASEGTQISLYDRIFADIGDEQSIEQSLSTFSSHMKNIVEILENAGHRSLVLFDELGAGTDPTEGAALAMAILENLHEAGAITVATTHYSELKVYALSTKGVENACCEFDVDTLKPTYKLLIGVPGKSNAFAISRRLGLKESVLDKAKEFLTQEDIRFEDLLMNIEKNRSEAEKEKIKAESYRLEIEKIKRALEEEKSKIESNRAKILKEAREEARRILQETKAESESMLARIRQLEKEQEASERNKAAEEVRAALRNKINGIEETLSETLVPRQGLTQPPNNLKPGDDVLIVNLNQKGVVLNPPDKDGETLVQAGIMKINVHISNLRKIQEQRNEIQKTGLGRISVSKSSHISAEIDLRGSTLDDAMESVDKYLDDASIAGLREIMIIHGKGTGVLRNGIHQLLRSNPHVKSFRLGKYGEGEWGVTIAELK
ncbi:MAG: endonuclease MutS2 [Clostridiales bacterium]|jgi:DNA mismatch repair protein MutS2|nr:endonuclease MutS2 [Eubacteriales bacterium]MDH7564884.1 endonuclease MutS2 [Clostridiales bacterium]